MDLFNQTYKKSSRKSVQCCSFLFDFVFDIEHSSTKKPKKSDAHNAVLTINGQGGNH